MEKFSNATFFRQIALQNLQHKNLGFSETDFTPTDDATLSDIAVTTAYADSATELQIFIEFKIL